jgi:hypothetical protein
MPHIELAQVLSSGFSASVHISLDLVAGILNNALSEGLILSGMSVGGFNIEIVSFSLNAELIDDRTPQELPSDMVLIGEDGATRPVTERPPPEDLLAANALIRLLIELTISRSSSRAQKVYLDLLLRPFLSSSSGLGVIRYDFMVRSGSPTGTENPVFTLLFYPYILDMLTEARKVLPKVEDQEILSLQLFPAVQNVHPDTLVLGVGSGDSSLLTPLLEPDEKFMLTINQAMFRQLAENASSNYPSRTYNWDERYHETIQRVELSLRPAVLLIDGEFRLLPSLYIEGSILIEPGGLLTPNVEFCFHGPILAKQETDSRGQSILKLDSSHIEVDADLPLLSSAESKVKIEIQKMIQTQLAYSLLGPFAFGMEIIGSDHFMTRISAVLWIEPSIAEFHEEGLMIGGRAIPGIKHHPKRVFITHIGRKEGRTTAYAFDDAFFLSRERAIALFLSNHLHPGNNVQVIRGMVTPHFRTRPDAFTSNNLSNLPAFNPETTSITDAQEFQPLRTGVRYCWVGSERYEVGKEPDPTVP